MTKKTRPDGLPPGVHIYRQSDSYASAVDPDRCCVVVSAGGRSCRLRQCGRRGALEWTAANGEAFRFCKQHHPDTVQKRRRETEVRWDAEIEARQREAAQHRLREAIVNEVLAWTEDDAILSHVSPRLHELVLEYRVLRARGKAR